MSNVPSQRSAAPFTAGGRRLTRPNLVRRVEQVESPFLLVVAPSGFGKTDLLSEWVRANSSDVAWLTCVDADQDPAHFWPRLIAVLGDRWPTMGTDAALTADRPSWQQDSLVTALAKDLAEVKMAGAIIVDDGQCAESAQQHLVALARALPPHLRLIMASQHNPVFSTIRLQVEGLLSELRASDLAFSREEADLMFRMAGIELTSQERGQLHALTEGWPAGLRLAVLALQHTDDPRQLIEAFASSTREATDYLANEVIARLPAELVDFLAKVSVLEDFDAELCAVVTGNPAARTLLETSISKDLFIFPVAATGERFRFHQMFAAYLRSRLKSRDPAGFRQAHQRASIALESRGDRAGALNHAMVVPDLERAAALVTDSVSKILEVDDSRQAATVAKAWLTTAGVRAIRTDPEQFLQFVFWLATYGYSEAERSLMAFDVVHPEPEPRLAALAHATWANLHVNRGEAELALRRNALAVEATAAAAAEDSLFAKLAELSMQEAAAHLLLGDLGAAGAALRRREPRVSAPIVDEVRLPAVRAWIMFLQGDLTMAKRLADQARSAAGEHHAFGHDVGVVLTALVDAGLCLEAGDLGRAQNLLTAARGSAQINGRPVVETIVERLVARCATALHDRADATAALAQARLVLGAPSSRVTAQIRVEELRVAAALSPNDLATLMPDAPDEAASRLLGSALAVRTQDWDLATRLLDSVEPITLRDEIEHRLLRAMAVQHRDLREAHSHTIEGLTLAMPHRYRTTLIALGPGIPELLRSLSAPPALDEYVDELLPLAERYWAPVGKSVTSLPEDLLTQRQVDVLRLLSSRLTTQEIADALFVSPNTLKSHIKVIYQKLHVNSRAEAVRAAGIRHMP